MKPPGEEKSNTVYRINADGKGPRNPSGTHPERFYVQPTVNEHFAWLRTRFALERSLMAGMHTSTILIAFGFTIVQVFERLQDETPDKAVLLPYAPRGFALALIGAGVLAAVVALIQYRHLIRYMWCEEFRAIAGMREKPYNSPLAAMTILIAVIGVFAFGSVLFRLS